MKTQYAPVIIPTLNRYEHFRNCVESLSLCTYAEETELVIGLDYPPSEEYVEGYKKIKEYLPNIIKFKRVTILEAKYNLGVDGNCKVLKEYVKAKGYDSYIFSEDDNVFAPAFLSFINWGLHYYENSPTILAICGYRENIPLPSYENNYYKTKLFRPYGFGIWLDKDKLRMQYMTIEHLRKDVDKMSFFDVFETKKIKRATSELSFIKKGAVHEDFCTNRFLEDGQFYCIVPRIPLVKNLGSDGSGIHGKNLTVLQKEREKLLDEIELFTPIVKSQQLITEETIVADKLSKEHSFIFKQFIKERIKMAYHRLKFLVYKGTGFIISYKGY